MSDAKRFAVRVLMALMFLAVAVPAEAAASTHHGRKAAHVKAKKRAAVHHAKKARHGRGKSITVRGGGKKVVRAKHKGKRH